MGRLLDKLKAFICLIVGCDNLPERTEADYSYPNGQLRCVCRRCGKLKVVDLPNAGKAYQGNWE